MPTSWVAFILDGITSVGGLPVHPEEWGAEAVVVGAQKCTAGPSGIAAIAVNQHFIDGVLQLEIKRIPILLTTLTLFPHSKRE